MPFITFKSTNVYYTDTGKGRALILLHGFLENQTMWNDYVRSLSKKNRVITIDLLGHGQTECIGYVHSMEEMANAVNSVLKKLKLKKYYIIGHSMGGYVALALAENNADSILGLMLFYSTTRADSKEKQLNRDKAIVLVKQNYKSFIRASLPMLFRPKSRRMYAKEIAELKKESLKMPQQGIVAALEGMKTRVDREALLHFAPFKIGFVSGKHDPVLHIDEQLEQHKAEKVTHVTVTENGHMGYIEDKKQAFTAILDFIKE